MYTRFFTSSVIVHMVNKELQGNTWYVHGDCKNNQSPFLSMTSTRKVTFMLAGIVFSVLWRAGAGSGASRQNTVSTRGNLFHNGEWLRL